MLFAFLLAIFLLYIAMRGELGTYLGLAGATGNW